MDDSNGDNDIQAIEFSPVPVVETERRATERSPFKAPIYLVILDEKTKKRSKLIKFETINLSKNGICIQTNAYPIKNHMIYELVLAYTLRENVTRIYVLDACSKWVKDGKVGFYFEARWQKK